MDEHINREALSDHVMAYGRPISCCVLREYRGVLFEIGNWVCDGKIYFVIKADGKVGECMEINAKADVVEVVRCKDCVSSEMYEFGCSGVKRLACVEKEDGVVRFAQAVDPMGYCSYGKRKDGEQA